jgi:CheY-like chemotaxis protein
MTKLGGNPMSRKKILIVDDDPDILDSLKTILEKHEHSVETASSENECLEKYAWFKPQIVLLDIMMESMDSGLKICRKIREDSIEVKIFMLSSVGDEYAGTSDYNEVGFNGSISKPVSPEKLLEFIK